ALGNHLGEAYDIPVGGAHAAMTGASANGLWLVCAMDANAWLVKADPHHTYRIVRSHGQVVVIAAAHTIFQNTLVPAEGWHLCDTNNAPGAWRCGQMTAAGGDG